MWMISTIMIITAVLIIANYYLGAKLYMTPSNSNYFQNVKEINVNNLKDILPAPKHVLTLTFLTAIVIGSFYAMCSVAKVSESIPLAYSCILVLLYVMELSKGISLNENTLVLSRFIRNDIVIPLATIEGMYIYSYNKRFLKKHAYTTKLVIVASGKKHKYTISSLENKAVLNMMKINFGITDYKMYIAKQ